MRNNQTAEGKVGYWEIRMDWDNADFHLRQALEGQILLDASAPDPKILRTTRDWMTDFLFPKMDNSISKEQWTEMSNNCKEWYMKNIHSNNGFYELVKQILYN